MSEFKLIKNKIIKDKLFWFSYLPLSVSFFIVAFILLKNPDITAEGVKNGLSVCSEVIIPSLFPLILFFNYLFDTGIFNIKTSFAEKITYGIFKLPSASFPIIVISMLGGYPIGSILIKKAYENNRLSLKQAKRMTLFCVNPGPAFTISTVGFFFLESKKTGLIMYMSTVAAALILGFILRFFDDEAVETIASDCKKFSLVNSVFNAVNTSVNNILNICVWIIIFSCFNELINSFDFYSKLTFLRIISEVTTGVKWSVEHYSLPVTCAIVAFGGLCVHMQIMPTLITLKLKYRIFLLVRILTSLLSALFMYLFLEFKPELSETALIGVAPDKVAVESSFPVCICMLFLCGLLILGDNYLFGKKQ